ncbi:MAG: multicopper oxidase domain-containing protein [Streptomycetales bacterium]
MHLLRYKPDKRVMRARRARLELVKAGVTRRDLIKAGMMTSAGVLLTEVGLPRMALASPPLTPFVEPLPIPPVLPERPVAQFDPAPTNDPNRAINPLTGLPFEGRSERHQSRDLFPAQKFFVTRMGANPNVIVHPDLPPQTLWGFNLGGADLSSDPPISPGPVIVTRYGSPALVRRFNALPPPDQNGGFGVPEVSTHLHNFHSAPDSDGGPCDPVQQRFFFRGQYYDYFYNMQNAGWGSTDPPNGNIEETLGFLWYHDHRVDHTAENTYKGLVGTQIAFNDFDTGDESTGFHLPNFPQFDIPLVLADRNFDIDSRLLEFDTFNDDGILGDRFLVNGKVQPFFEAQKRRYRFRVLDVGPSRFYEFFLTNPDDLTQRIPFWVISSDGNLLPRPIEVTSYRLGVAERVDIIVDFNKIATRFGNPSRIRLENRLEQTDGREPNDNILPAGAGDQLLEFQLVGGAVADDSFDPEPVSSPRVPASATDCVFGPICLPDISNVTPRLERTFRFDRTMSDWVINNQLMDCTRFRFNVEANSAEKWIIQNNSNGWQHPIHIHLEEFRILSRNGRQIGPGDVEFGRKDVFRLGEGESVEILIRFRDFLGGYPMHCHNTVHEDHQMMLLWNVAETGDDNPIP